MLHECLGWENPPRYRDVTVARKIKPIDLTGVDLQKLY
jgi:hypothetical protein